MVFGKRKQKKQEKTQEGWVSLSRDCDALLVPNAVPITLPAGSQVFITQNLGGSITVNINGNLARIDGKDADALGLEPQVKTTNTPKTADGPVDLDLVWAALKKCFDPEIPVNIVDLGLIYECTTTPINDNTGNRVDITMTLTAAGCGMGPVLTADVEALMRNVPNVTEVKIDLVFDPPWSQEKMSEAAKLELGMFY